jgi:hypothetical protein
MVRSPRAPGPPENYPDQSPPQLSAPGPRRPLRTLLLLLGLVVLLALLLAIAVILGNRFFPQ